MRRASFFCLVLAACLTLSAGVARAQWFGPIPGVGDVAAGMAAMSEILEQQQEAAQAAAAAAAANEAAADDQATQDDTEEISKIKFMPVSISKNIRTPDRTRYRKDTDGDGIPDATDNCIDVANVYQADADNDSVGDACDICKDDATDQCEAKAQTADDDSLDSDGDGITDANDECELDAGDFENNGCPLSTDQQKDVKGIVEQAQSDAAAMESIGSCSLMQGSPLNAVSLLLMALAMIPIAVKRSR